MTLRGKSADFIVIDEITPMNIHSSYLVFLDGQLHSEHRRIPDLTTLPKNSYVRWPDGLWYYVRPSGKHQAVGLAAIPRDVKTCLLLLNL